MKIYFMRHGCTNYNELGLCNDDPRDPVYLTELGKQQARDAARRLSSVPLQRMVVSELPRTRQTADIVNEFHRVPIDVHPALNDIRSGYNNRPVAEYQAAIAHDPLRARVNGGESLLDYKSRVLTFLDWLRARREDALLVVAHEETLRIFAAHARGLTDEEIPELSFANCEIFEWEK